MTEKEKYNFLELKKQVSLVFFKNNSASSHDFIHWKLSDIDIFREDFFKSVNATISEKWFYTYFKNDTEKLPRIDMLNLLANYVGFTNWATFCDEKKEQKIVVKKYSKKRLTTIGIIVALGCLLSAFLYFNFQSKNTFSFCFKDGNFSTPASYLKILILKEDESPTEVKTDVNGCLQWATNQEQITLVIESPYYKKDTIVRNITKTHQEEITLKNDNYSLILTYYSQSNIKDWKKRRQELNKMIAENALIYRIYKSTKAIEIYSKSEFINKLTLPTNTLKNIEILETKIENNQLNVLKFWVKK